MTFRVWSGVLLAQRMAEEVIGFFFFRVLGIVVSDLSLKNMKHKNENDITLVRSILTVRFTRIAKLIRVAVCPWGRPN